MGHKITTSVIGNTGHIFNEAYVINKPDLSKVLVALNIPITLEFYKDKSSFENNYCNFTPIRSLINKQPIYKFIKVIQSSDIINLNSALVNNYVSDYLQGIYGYWNVLDNIFFVDEHIGMDTQNTNTGTTITIPTNYRIDKIKLVANNDCGTISLGITENGSEILSGATMFTPTGETEIINENNDEILSGETEVITSNENNITIKEFYPLITQKFENDTIIYVSSDNLNDGELTIYIKYKL